MAFKKFTDADGQPLVVQSEQVLNVWHFIPEPPVPPTPPSPLNSCIAFIGGGGVYVQESVEKVLSILEN